MKKQVRSAALLGLVLSLGLTGGQHSAAQSDYRPSASNLEARKTFRDHGFGIFLHWGLYSTFAQGEWYMTNANLDHAEYAKAAAGFYPSRFDAEAWVKAIKASGAGYLTITSRHHDSFSLWDTKLSDYNMVRATPFRRDVLRELHDACRKYGLGFHVYYSLLDWSREDYTPLGRTGRGTNRHQSGKWTDYDAFMKGQLTELVRDYDADAIWFDGEWDQDQNPSFDWGFPSIYKLIHQLKPSCLIGNNHHGTPHEGEDFQMFERDVPGANTAGLSGQAISKLPLETCQTMNGMWGYKIADQNYKSDSTLIRLLVSTAGRDANLLLNIGPEPSGALPALALDRLSKIGAWMQRYGQTVRGVRAGLLPPQEWGVTTQHGRTLYLHILSWGSRLLSLPLTAAIKSVKSYDSQRAIPYRQTKEGLTLTFEDAPSRLNALDYIVQIELR